MLYCILGKAGSGKDTLLKRVLEKNKNLKVAISHTTRPIRKNEIDGVDYHFISEKEFIYMDENNEFIETRKYNVVDEEKNKNIWYYGLSYDAIKENNDYLVIVDVKGLNELKRNLKGTKIISFYIEADKEIRRQRYINRDKMSNKKLKEMERRFIADEEDFSLSKLEGIDYFLNNNNLNDLLVNEKLINKIIKQNSNKERRN